MFLYCNVLGALITSIGVANTIYCGDLAACLSFGFRLKGRVTCFRFSQNLHQMNSEAVR